MNNNILFLMADGNNNTYIFILKFSKTFLEFKWGSDCFKGCYTVKMNISLAVK